jgi:hypothetical protein
MINSTAIRKAIAELLEGTIGTTRDMATAGNYSVMSVVQEMDGLLQINTRYQVEMPHSEQHSASPVSAIGSHKIDSQEIVVHLYHVLQSNIQKDERNSVRDNVIYVGDRARQALGYPNNLTTTASATATGIISGMLTELSHDIIEEQWDENPPRIESQIRGVALLHITQLTS